VLPATFRWDQRLRPHFEENVKMKKLLLICITLSLVLFFVVMTASAAKAETVKGWVSGATSTPASFQAGSNSASRLAARWS